MLELTDPETICWDICLAALNTRNQVWRFLQARITGLGEDLWGHPAQELAYPTNTAHIPQFTSPMSLNTPRDGDPNTPRALHPNDLYPNDCSIDGPSQPG